MEHEGQDLRLPGENLRRPHAGGPGSEKPWAEIQAVLIWTAVSGVTLSALFAERPMSILGDITGAIGLVKQAKELADQLKNLELKSVIVELQSKLLDLKEEINQLRDGNTRLADEEKRAT